MAASSGGHDDGNKQDKNGKKRFGIHPSLGKVSPVNMTTEITVVAGVDMAVKVVIEEKVVVVVVVVAE
ncbi:hypothetical protein [Photobacterium sp. TY1-4]|uniref:hypothetical protein n=1 Tax=Photobacterium sp. TY1-4 TaxID=2899122 RepID=UPI0021BE936F|nr:hypothetical protein [Photobacterium sp. TY1-4]UXI00218.1 hypothetical protein NH461_10340 [Photobacterium sp. TY1-4]